MSHARIDVFTHYVIADKGYPSPCWLWQGSISENGYGIKSNPVSRKKIYLHRLYYEKFKGLIPAGFQIDHLCRERRCVNPDHLEAVTQVVNIHRGENVKITMEIADEIRELYKNGFSLGGLSIRYKMSKCNVGHIIRNKIWTQDRGVKA
jgi:hypothetical protein